MISLDLPANVSVRPEHDPDSRSVHVEMDGGHSVILAWYPHGQDLRVVCCETGPGVNRITVYEDMIEADEEWRELHLEFEDGIEYHRALLFATRKRERRQPVRLVA